MEGGGMEGRGSSDLWFSRRLMAFASSMSEGLEYTAVGCTGMAAVGCTGMAAQ